MEPNLLSLFDTSVAQFSTQVAAVGSGDWDKPTPDTEWSVTDLVQHLIDEHRWMPPLIGGHDLETAQKIVESQAATSSGDHAADWQAACTASLQAVGEPGALERTVSLSRGPTPANEYLVEMIFDATIHAWDLGTALGTNPQLPDELVAFLFPVFQSMGDMSSTGMFKAPVPVPDDAPEADKLLAATGRNPR
jgi:uncharacterized protein (TIGR03086 family)